MTREEVTDALLARPHGFTAGGRHFYLYPITLGRLHMIAGLDLGIGDGLPSLEILKAVRERREACARVLAIYTLPDRWQVLGDELTARQDFFAETLDDEDLCALLISAFSIDRTKQLIAHYGLDREAERKRRVMQVKDSKNTWTFGGLTVYGNIIDAACQRYGWTYDYVVWEISYTNLVLMLRDQVSQVYLTDKERKRCHVPNGSVADGNNEEQVRAFMKMTR